MSETKKYTRLLLRAVRELAYIQDVENCHSGLCKTAEGKSIVDDGMAALGLRDLSDEAIGECCARLRQPPARMSARESMEEAVQRIKHAVLETSWMADPNSSRGTKWFEGEVCAAIEKVVAHCAAAQPSGEQEKKA